MHPPLDRPHPDCQGVIDALKQCHAQNSKLLFWKCNTAKYELDECFKEEKQRMLKEMNKNFAVHRAKEDDLLKEALGQNMSFQEYLEKDKHYAQVRQEQQHK